MKLQLGILASHGGSNAQAIIDACAQHRIDAEVRVLISNNSDSPALQRARRAGIPALHLSSETHRDSTALDAAILDALVSCGVNLVALAGYMKKLGPRTLKHFRGRIVNVHPALLPKFGGRGMYGMRVHEAVIAAGEKISGATIHLVDQDYDTGPILAQREVPVLPGDTSETLAARVLKVEHALYVETLARIASGAIRLE
jgi:phosphoribosylglycinamide formyltransferase 1